MSLRRGDLSSSSEHVASGHPFFESYICLDAEFVHLADEDGKDLYACVSSASFQIVRVALSSHA